MATTPLSIFRRQRYVPVSQEPTNAQEGEVIMHATNGFGYFSNGTWHYFPSLAALEAAYNAQSQIITSQGQAITALEGVANSQAQTITTLNSAVQSLIETIDETLKAPQPFTPNTGNYPVPATGESIERGDTFRIVASGTMGGQTVNAEDLLIALVDNPSPTNDADWQVAESNRLQASTAVKGVTRYATAEEAEAKTSTEAAVTPAALESFSKSKVFAVTGDGQSVEFSFNHNLNSRIFGVTAREAQAPYSECQIEVVSVSPNEAKAVFDVVLPVGFNINVLLTAK